jgi:DNA invertase Pin-like site-specific DNA recombinase
VRVIGYARRSTEEQPTTLAAQEGELGTWAAGGGHVVVRLAVETISGGTEPEDRPVLAQVLNQLAAGTAEALVVTTTDRLARTHAVHRLDYYATREGWRLLILDALERHHDPEARLLHGIRVTLAEYERSLISRRTRAGLAQRRAAGVRLGGPRRCPDAVLAEVVRLRAAGARLVDIAEALNAAGEPTPGGGVRWWPSHVSRLLATQDGHHALQAAYAARQENAPCGS